MQNKVDTFCIFRALSNRQISVSGKVSESGRISAGQRAPFEPGRWTQPRSKKPQRACDRWYSLGVIFSNRGGNSGLRSLSARHPPEPRLRCWNSASVIVPADAGIPSGPISRCAVIPDGLPGIGLLHKRFVGLGAMATQPEFVEQLFESALALKPAQREAFLDQACSHDLE